MLAPALAATLAALAPLLPVLRDDWWLIGSAAMALLGVDDIDVADVDVLAEPGDAAALLDALGSFGAPGRGSDRFRSELFGRWTRAPLPIEVMGGLHVRQGDGHVRLVPMSRQPVRISGACFFTPSITEMVAICELFGRPKDLERAARMRARLP